MDCLQRVATPLLAFVTLLATSNTTAIAQTQSSGLKNISVVGRVVRVYRSDDHRNLVELQIATAKEGLSPQRDADLPPPGPVAFIKIEDSGRPASRAAIVNLPPVGQTIRARISSDQVGVWTAKGDWFTVLPEEDKADTQAGRTPAEVDAYGMSCKAVLAGGRLGLEVQKVADSGPAHEAGLQTGDVIVGINQRPLTSAADLRHATSKDGAINLIVIDVNSGRVASVEMPADAPTTERTADDDAKLAEERILKTLGLTVEKPETPAAQGVVVRSVQPASGGAGAGIEPGDVIVGVGNQRVASLQDLADAIPDTPRRLTVLVKDVRTGRDVPVEVKSAGIAAAETPRTRRPTPPANTRPATGGLGVHGELTFYNAEAAVRVAAVDRDSPADRAGIREGMILLSADGKPLLHPKDLQAIADSRGPVVLRLVDPTTRRELSVNVNR